MSLAQIYVSFNADLTQCDNLIANAHKVDASGNAFLSVIDQQQITVAAFLNMFIAWETFLEASLIAFMMGNTTINGNTPTKYITPPTIDHANALVRGINRYFDYGNHHNMKKMVNLFFQGGSPYEPHLSAIYSDLDDLKTMRNASAHISSTTQTALEALALRVLAQPKPNITLYQFLTIADPRSSSSETIFLSYKNKLVVAAELIARG